MFDIHTPAALHALSQRLSLATRLVAKVVSHTDSTNAQLLAQADALPLHPDAPLALMALSQSAGRGRMGRAWTVGGRTHPAFLASLGLRTTVPLAALGILPLHVGVAVAQYLQDLGVDVGLKWPNDIVLHSNSQVRNTPPTQENLPAKLGGILIETRVVDAVAGVTAVVIGLGLNWYSAPNITGRNIACIADVLSATALPTDETATAALLAAMSTAWQRTERGERCEFAAFDVLAGRSITLHSTTATPMNLYGVAQGINSQGLLGLRTAQGLHWLHSGEVSLSLPTLPNV